MGRNLSRRFSTTSGGSIGSSGPVMPDVPEEVRYFLIQETEQTETVLRRRDRNGITVMAEMPDSDGVLQKALVRWHHLVGELSKSAFIEITEEDFYGRLHDQFSDRNIIKFSSSSDCAPN